MLEVLIQLLASRDPKEASVPLTHWYWSWDGAGPKLGVQTCPKAQLKPLCVGKGQRE